MDQTLAQINRFVEKMRIVQQSLLDFIDKENFEEKDFSTFANFLQVQKISQSKEELSSLLHLIVQLANDHHRIPPFYTKIEKILTFLKSDIQQKFTKSEIFYIFKKNKRLLLFTFQQELIIPNEMIANLFSLEEYQLNFYPHYFLPELKPFYSKELLEEIDLEEISNEKREIGENDSIISQIIQKDQIDDFIVYINQNSISLTSEIDVSIYETNSLLLRDTEIIEYAAFYGSIRIFLYLVTHNVPMHPNLWLYAIHGRNPEIIQILEERNIHSDKNMFNNVLRESIKCHHNEFKDYFETNFVIQEKIEKPKFTQIDIKERFRNEDLEPVFEIISYFNYLCFPDLSDCISFEFFCLSKNLPLVELFMNIRKMNVNSTIEYVENERKVEMPLLYVASKIGSSEIVNFLLENPNIEVNCLTNTSFPEIEKYSPLHIAITETHYKIFRLLLNHPKIDVNFISTYEINNGNDYYKTTKKQQYIPIFDAIKSYDIRILKLLLSRPELDVNILKDSEKTKIIQVLEIEEHTKMTPLHYLILRNDDLYSGMNDDKYEYEKCLLARPDIDFQKNFIESYTEDFICPVNFKEMDCKDTKYLDYEKKFYQKEYYKTEEYTERTDEISILLFAIQRRKFEFAEFLLNKKDIDVNSKSIHSYYQKKYFSNVQYGQEECYSIDKERIYHDFTHSNVDNYIGEGGLFDNSEYNITNPEEKTIFFFFLIEFDLKLFNTLTITIFFT